MAYVGWHEGGRMFRAQCSHCWWQGTKHAPMLLAKREAEAHRCPF